MNPDSPPTPDDAAAHLIELADADARRHFLLERRDTLDLALVEALKARADAEMLRDAGRALHIAGIAAEVAAQLDDPLAEPLALWVRGNALGYLGHYRECLDCFERARATFAQHGQSLKATRLRINEVAVLKNLGRYTDALHAAKEAREMLSTQGPTRYEASLETNVGNIHSLQSDYDAALAAYRRAKELYRALNDEVQQARADVNRAIVMEYLDRFDEAEQLLEVARQTLLANETTQEVARVDLNLGALLLRQARYQEALRHLENAHDGFTMLENRLEVAVADLDRAQVYLALNLLPEALALAEECEREFKGRGMKRQVALAGAIQGTALRGMGKYEAALRLFDRVRRGFRGRGAVVEVARMDLERAALQHLTGHAARARRIARRAEKVFQAHRQPVRAAQAQLLQAQCALDLDRPRQAETLALAARQVADQLGLATLAYRAHHILGRTAEAQKQNPVAFEQYQTAVEAIERLRRDLWMDEFRIAFLGDKLAVYEDAVRLALSLQRLGAAFQLAESANAAAQAGLTPQELARAPDKAGQKLLEELRALRRTWHWKHSQMERSDEADEGASERAAVAATVVWQELQTLEAQIAELTRRWRARRASPQEDKHSGLVPDGARFPSSQRDDAVLVQYYVLRGQIGAFVAHRGQVAYVGDLAPVAKIERLLESWRFGLESLKLYPADFVTAHRDALCVDARIHLRRLYDLLVRPLPFLDDPETTQPDTFEARRLYVNPHPALNGVPFAGLFDGSRHLIEAYQIVYVTGGPPDPGAGPPPLNNPIRSPLVVGYSNGGRLPFAVTEAQEVAAALDPTGRPHLLLEEAATEAAFYRHSREADLIHLATHAAFRSDNPFFSWLRLADARPTVADLYGLGLTRRPLVTLSACETGLGGRRDGGLIGASRALMAAGAAAVIASLWKVDDASTARLMRHFYQHLAAGGARSAALRAAQREILQALQHPLYWAGFVLVERAAQLGQWLMNFKRTIR